MIYPLLLLSSNFKRDFGKINRIKWFFEIFRNIKVKIIDFSSLERFIESHNVNLIYVLSLNRGDLSLLEGIKETKKVFFYDALLELRSELNFAEKKAFGNAIELYHDFKSIQGRDERRSKFLTFDKLKIQPKQIFGKVNGKPFFWQNEIGTEFYLGMKDFFGTIRGGYFEYGRIGFYLPVLEKTLNFSTKPLIGVKLTQIPVVFRIDDVPTIWLFTLNKEKVMNLNMYKKLIQIAKRTGFKLSFMVSSTLLSETLKLKTWPEVGGESWNILKFIIDPSNKNHVEIGLHGLHHASKSINAYHFKLYRILRIFHPKIRHLVKEYYDCYKGEPLSFDYQDQNLRKAMKILMELTSFRVFCPPSHVWDNNTELILEKLGIEFLSADNNAEMISSKVNWKNASLIGTNSELSKKIMYLSGTIYGDITSFKKSIPYLVDLGIPIVWVKHTVSKDWLSPKIFKESITLLDKNKVKGFTISELGDLLKRWKQIKISMDRYFHSKYSPDYLKINAQIEPVIYGNMTNSKKSQVKYSIL